MLEIAEVQTKKQIKDFLDFPLKLYKGNKSFVPPLYGDEKKMFRADYVYYDTCKSVFFVAYEDKKPVGRIQGILQMASNEKNNEKRVRFTRFDTIDDRRVSAALFEALEGWAKKIGMDTVCGPLGFSDLEREGLLIDGFEELSTFEEQYNAPYYAAHIESLGYEKEVDWFESKIYLPKDEDGTIEKTAEFVLKRYDLHMGEAKNTKEFLDKYAEGFFALLDEAYEGLYGTVPFTDGMKRMLIDNFKLILDKDHIVAVLDKDENMVCMGLCFPSIAKAVQKSNGKLTPAALIRLLRAIKRPEIIDLGLIAVKREYLNRGISAIVSAAMVRILKEKGVKYAETNLNLENNHAILNQWKRFDAVRHKVRRSYVKKL